VNLLCPHCGKGFEDPFKWANHETICPTRKIWGEYRPAKDSFKREDENPIRGNWTTTGEKESKK
jgi:hypothetical protein